MSCLIAKEIRPDYELAFLPFAVLLIVGAHWLNYRWCRSHRRYPAPASSDIPADPVGGPAA
jgi:hypothetical protein